jgi:predicted  nucleic acid-binding Zn-ribbon protein
MTNLQAILNYQDVDRELYAIERELSASEERKEYVKMKKFLEAAPEKLDALEAKATALKLESVGLNEQYAKAEETLKDFDSLDELLESGADVAFYKKKAQSVMEQLKKLKAELSSLTASVNATSEEYQKLKKQVIAAQKLFKTASEKYNALKATKEGARKEIEEKLAVIEKGVSSEILEKYKNKRKERIFPVIGKLFDKRCPFCSMEPPLAAVNKLTGGETIECDSCHRIIYQD